MKEVMVGFVWAFLVSCASAPRESAGTSPANVRNFAPPTPEATSEQGHPLTPEERETLEHRLIVIATTAYSLGGSAVSGGAPDTRVYDGRQGESLERKLKAIAVDEETKGGPLAARFDQTAEITSNHTLVYHATSAALEPHGTMTPRLRQDGRIGIRVAIKNRALLGFVDHGKPLLNLRKTWDKDAHLFPDFEDQRLDKEAIVREGQYLLVGPFMDSNMDRVENRKPDEARPTATGRQRYFMIKVAALPVQPNS